MATDPRQFLKADSAQLSIDALMLARPEVLRGVDASQQTALEALDIRTVFDLAASAAFGAARRLLLLQTDATQPEAQLQRVAADIADTPAGVPVADLALLPIAALKAVGAARAVALRTALATTTVRDLALWPPYSAARAVLAEQLAGGDPVPLGDPGTPPELLPKNGAFPTERVSYRRLLIDSTSDTGVLPLEQRNQALSLDEVLTGSEQGFTRVAMGALLTFNQDWFSQGVALGQLLHCLSLAPGESTRMAMIDWSRQSLGRSSEDVNEAERLANTTTHQRALSEVTEATANEVQRGSSRSTTNSSSSQGGSALGFEIGPIAFGGSSGGGSSRTEALTVTSSFGRRDLSASVAQQINDVSQQQASAARSRRASIVQEVSQSEHQALSTRVVCNYNHMHALNVQYYEVVQAFRVTTTLQRAERVIFVPLKLVDFKEPLTLERWRGALADEALTDDIRRQLTTEFGVVEIRPNLPRLRVGDAVATTSVLGNSLASVLAAASVPNRAAPAANALDTNALGTNALATNVLTTKTLGTSALAAAPLAFTRTASQVLGMRLADNAIRAEAFAGASPEAAAAATAAVRDLRSDLGPAQSGSTLTALKGFDTRQLSRVASLSGRTLLRDGSDAVFVPDDARLLGLSLKTGRASGLRVRNRAGADLAPASRSANQLTLEEPARFADLQGVFVQPGADDSTGAATLRLLVDIGGSALPLDVPVVLPAIGQTAQIISFAPVRASPALQQHLNDNALHYSRVVFQRLDSSSLSALLARFTLRGLPLGALVDPQPVALVANALAFRLNLPMRGTVDNPALAAEQEAWLRFLQRRGLERPIPQSQTVPLPTGGVFAEAVLGRFNSAEKIDLTRFFDWQASPIPLTPPEIAALPSDSRQRAVDLSTSALGAPLLKQTEATALPAGVNSAAILAAMQAGSPFRDLSAVIAANAGLAQAGSEATGAGATAAATQAADTLQTVMAQNTERLKIAADLFLATQGAGQGDADKAKASPTATGLAMTTADRQDKAAQNADTPAKAATAASGATLEQQAQAAQTGATGAATAQAAIDQAVAGASQDSQAQATAPTPRRGNRRVQSSTPASNPVAPKPVPSAIAPAVAGIKAALQQLSDVPFSVAVQAAPGGQLPSGQRTLRISDASGRTLLSLNTTGNAFTGTRPRTDQPVTYEVVIQSLLPPMTLSAKRRMIPPGDVAGPTENLQVRPVVGRRELLLPLARVDLLLMDADQLLALPEMLVHAGDFLRLADKPKVAVRSDGIAIVFAVFETTLANRQILA